MPVFLSEKNLGAQIVPIPALTVHDAPEQSFVRHPHDHHFHSAVATVFEKHKRCLRCFLLADERVAVLQGIRPSDLQSDRLFGAQRRTCNFHMRLPCGHNQNRIHIGACQNIAVVRASERTDTACFFNQCLCRFNAVRITVTDSTDRTVIHSAEKSEHGVSA
ncbi:unknown [Clostridium sp. CAG:448]|nr:unknown [Clostridium sp. CAG:448]